MSGWSNEVTVSLLLLRWDEEFEFVYQCQISDSKDIHEIIRLDTKSMLATSKNVLFQGHNHLLTTSADNLTL